MRSHPLPCRCLIGATFVALVAYCGAALAQVDFGAARRQFTAAAQEEIKRGVLPGFSVAWIVDREAVYAAGHGLADWKNNVPATAETVYRAGSISKLFNALAAMQLVEQDKLSLDAPIQQALPDFSIINRFSASAPITLRQLLCHRSGLVREAPVGGYLDPSQPTIVETLASVSGCVLVHPPNTKTRYSNVGPTVAGRAVEVLGGLPYAEYQRRHLLEPLGMSHSAWTMNDHLRPRLAKGRMRIARGDGEYYFDVAPEFELGTLPAGNLYTTANDLARFAAFLMEGDPSSELSPPLVHPASLEMMLTPQLIDGETGFGLGFFVGRYRGFKTVQHSGAVYGFTTFLIVLPDEGIGVLVLSNADIAIGPVRRLADLSLDLLLETARGAAPPSLPSTIELASDALEPLAGEYESTSYWARLWVEGTSLTGELSGQPLQLAATAPNTFLADGRIMHRNPLEFVRGEDGRPDAFDFAGQRFRRVDPRQSQPPPAAWQALVGTYGPEFIPLVISIRNGHLYATIENEYDYRLKPLNRVTFELPPGMYSDEQVVFQLDAAGNAVGAIMAGMYLPRRD